MDSCKAESRKVQRRRFVADYLALCLVTASCCLLDWAIFSLELRGVRLAARWCVSTALSLYVTGFCTWSFTRMAMAYLQPDYHFGLWRSGWGHGCQMAMTLIVKFAFVLPWLALFLAPGLRKLLSYELVEFVRVEHPQWSARRCLSESARLMYGNRRHFVSFHIGAGVIHYLSTMLPIVSKLIEFIVAPLHSVKCAKAYEEYKRRDLAEPVDL